MSFIPPHGARGLAALVLGFVVAVVPAAAQTRSGALALLPEDRTETHTLVIPSRDGEAERRLDYVSEAGTLSLLGGDGAATAEIFHVAYTLAEPGENARERPVTFVFNGGPGAASAYLHIGALGPRVLATAPDGSFLPPPHRLVDNPDTWLTLTDLVFVDPVGTGYSRPVSGDGRDRFWGVDEDATAMAAFIRLWLLENDRTGAPIYLAGESYGGFRAAKLARVLQQEAGLTPSGAVLISPALEFFLVYPDEFNPLQHALRLPAMAAVNLESRGVTDRRRLAERLAEVETYALGDYLSAIANGLEEGGRRASERVAAYTGLPLDVVRRHYARVPIEVFVKEFDRPGGRLFSLYDGAVAGPDVRPESAGSETPDPVLDRSVPVLTSAFVAYLRDELGYRTDMSYRLLNRDVGGRWNYGTSPSRQGYAGSLDDLQEARALNPALRVLIAHGYTDLITPYFVADYLVGQLPTLEGAAPIRLENYAGGHMMYFRPSSRRELRQDVDWVYRAGQGDDAISAPPPEAAPAPSPADSPAPSP